LELPGFDRPNPGKKRAQTNKIELLEAKERHTILVEKSPSEHDQRIQQLRNNCVE